MNKSKQTKKKEEKSKQKSLTIGSRLDSKEKINGQMAPQWSDGFPKCFQGFFINGQMARQGGRWDESKNFPDGCDWYQCVL